MRRARRKQFGRNQFFARPEAGQRVQPVGQRLAKDDDVGRDAEVLDGPEFSRAIETHLDFVIHDENLVRVAGFLEPGEVISRRDDVAARALHRLDVERAELGGFRLRIPNRVVLGVKELRELVFAVELARLTLQAVDAAEAVGKKDELSAVAKVAVAAAIAVARSDGGSAERPAVIAAHESENQVLARKVPHDLERILDGLRSAHVEMHSPFDAEALFAGAGDARRHFHFLGVQILAGQLRQAVELALQRLDEPLIFVAEARGGIPHLEIEIRRALLVKQIRALATREDLGRIEVVDGIAEGADLPLERQNFRELGGGVRNRHESLRPPQDVTRTRPASFRCARRTASLASRSAWTSANVSKARTLSPRSRL